MRISRLAVLAAIVAAPALYLACGDDDSGSGSSPDAGKSEASAVDGSITEIDSSMNGSDASRSDGATDAGTIQRGPLTMNFDPSGNGDPISMHWNDAKQVLYIADNNNNQIWTWTDKDGFKKLGKLLDDPAADDAGATSLGQIVQLSNGLLVVPRFGKPTFGALLTLDPATGDAGAAPGYVATRKRTALAAGATDQLWGGYFIQPGDHLGVVTMDSLTAGETDYATGFDKPVGVLVQDGHLLVSEQQTGIIYQLPLDGGFPAGGPYDVFANVAACDALTGGPNGSVITGQFKVLTDGGPVQLRQAFPDGGVEVLAPDAGLVKPKGVAYDKTNKRLFVADSNDITYRTIKILPLD